MTHQPTFQTQLQENCADLANRLDQALANGIEALDQRDEYKRQLEQEDADVATLSRFARWVLDECQRRHSSAFEHLVPGEVLNHMVNEGIIVECEDDYTYKLDPSLNRGARE